jgi:outer membrane protein assembly factor BamB
MTMMKSATFLCAAMILWPATLRAQGDVLPESGVKGGIVVSIGWETAEALAALKAGDAFLVQGLDPDPEKVARARDALHAKGLYGGVSVMRWSGPRLPHAEEIVNLLVVAGAAPPEAELMRVLVPGGVLMVRQEGGWTRTVKPRPGEIDEWTHYLHGPDNNPVARDRRVGPPVGLKWFAKPLWARHHEWNNTLPAMVSGGGRVYYVFDMAPAALTTSVPEDWTLFCRDAFNGKLLWKQRLKSGMKWGGTAFHDVPLEVARRLVADGDVLYAIVDKGKGIQEIDGATGKILRELEGTVGATEMICLDGKLYVGVRGGILLLDPEPEKGKILWERKIDGTVVPRTLATNGEAVLCQTTSGARCLDARTGEVRWKTGAAGKKGKTRLNFTSPSLSIHGDVVLQGSGETGLTALDMKDGKPLWNVRNESSFLQYRTAWPTDVFVIDGKAWYSPGGGLNAYDLRTGEVLEKIDTSSVRSMGHHLRCYRAKATERYVIGQTRGAEFVGVAGDGHSNNDWVRGPCHYGLMPANGLLYVPQNPCLCFPGVKLNGLNALHADPGTRDWGAMEKAVLEKGPAYGSVEKGAPGTGAWPAYRAGPGRHGFTAAPVPAKVKALWTSGPVASRTAPTIADGLVYTASRETHAVYAHAAADGAERWRFTADGPVDTPPTIHEGLALFGSADGHVYALRAADGALCWRFRVAPGVRLVGSESRIESAWPAHGSVMVMDGRLYCTAGRNTFLDGGIRLLALDPRTGALLAEARIDTANPLRKDAEGTPVVPAYHIEGARSDLLVGEGGFVFLGQYKFSPDLERQETPYRVPDKENPEKAINVKGKPYTGSSSFKAADYVSRYHKELAARLRQEHGGVNLGDRDMGVSHVLTTSGFLDDAYFNRTFWMVSSVWPGYHYANRAAKGGNLVVVGPERTFALQAFPDRPRSPMFTMGKKGYLLLADENATRAALDDAEKGITKVNGFTRDREPAWFRWLPTRIRAMALAGDVLLAAGPPDKRDKTDPYGSFEGNMGSTLHAFSVKEGKDLFEVQLESAPVFDGMAAAGGRIYVTLLDGRIACYGE